MIFTRAERRTGVAATVFAALLMCSQTLSAQEGSTTSQPQVSKGEANLAKKLQEGTDVAAKVKTAEKFIKEYPKSPLRAQVAQYTAGQIGTVPDAAQKLALVDAYLKIFNEPGEALHVAPSQVESYTKLKRYDDAFRIGNTYLAGAGEDLLVRLHLAVEGTNQARAGNRKYAAETRGYATKAIEIIESGKKPADLTDADWTTAQTAWRARLYQSLGFLSAAENNPAEALTNFEKATKADAKDVNSWAMLGFITNQNYQELAKQYTVASGSEQAALKQKAEAELDKVIELYARVVAMTDGVAEQANLNTQMRADLEAYYKYRNNNSTDGLQKLIDKYKTAK